MNDRARPHASHTWALMLRLGLVLGCSLLLLSLWARATRAHENPLPPDTFTGPCSAWTPVNDGAFGMGTGGDGDYSSEEGFEVAVFDGQLYVGMEADNIYGARLWRTKAGVRVPTGQADWEEVAADENGWPFGNPVITQNDHIDSLAVFQGALYASTANGGASTYGTLVYSSTTGDPGSWTQVITAGFGDVHNTNFKDMRVFQDWLCGGTQNTQTGAQVWCTQDGAQWAQKNVSGFDLVSNTLIASTGVFSDAFYVGVANKGNSGSVWRTDDLATWTQVFTSTEHPRVEIAAPFGGYLTIAAGAYDGRYGGGPLRLYRSATGDPSSWEEVGHAVGADPHNTRTIVDGATVYNGALYLATMNTVTGAEVWRTTDGVTWAQVNTGGFGYTTTFAAQLIPYRGYLYAWTSDYVTGQRVYRTCCGSCYTIYLPVLLSVLDVNYPTAGTGLRPCCHGHGRRPARPVPNTLFYTLGDDLPSFSIRAMMGTYRSIDLCPSTRRRCNANKQSNRFSQTPCSMLY